MKGLGLKDANLLLSFDMEFIAKNLRNAFIFSQFNPSGGIKLS